MLPEIKVSGRWLSLMQFSSYVFIVFDFLAFVLFIVVILSESMVILPYYAELAKSHRHAVEFGILCLSALAIATSAAAIVACSKKVGTSLDSSDSKLADAVKHLDTSMDSFEKKIAEVNECLEETADEVRDTRRGSFEAAFSIIKAAVNLSKPEYNLSKDSKIIQLHAEWLKGLSHNINSWDDRLRQTRDTSDHHKNFSHRAWLTVGKSYFREEAYDIRRGEIVTNARNYIYILIGLVTELVSLARAEGKVLYYYAITPANPKDWYQYPHGRSKPYLYYEEEFVSIFYRSLCEIVKANHNNLSHRRYIICCNEDNDDARKRISNIIGADIEKRAKVEADLKHIILHYAPLTGNEFGGQFGYLYQFHNEISARIYASFKLSDKRLIYIWSENEAWNGRWENNYPFKECWPGIRTFLAHLPLSEGKEFWEKILHLSLNEYNDAWEKWRDDIFDIASVKLNRIDSRSSDAWNRLWSKEVWDSESFDYSEMLDSCHQLSIMLQDEQLLKELPKEFQGIDVIHKLIYMGLSYRDLRRRLKRPELPKLLKDEFGGAVHTDGTKGLFLLPIKNEPDQGINKFWLRREIAPEVSLFGIGPQNARKEQIDWSLAVTIGSLNYPFDILRLELKTGQSELQNYKECMQQIDDYAVPLVG